MKKLWLLTILVVFQLSFRPAESGAQTRIDRNISFGGKRMTLKDAFQELEKLSGLSISYNNTKLDDQRILNVNKADRTVKQSLLILLNGTAFTFRMGNGDNVLIVEKPSQGKITGKVYDENGDPLPGAVVRLKGLGLSRQTENDGSYTLDVAIGNYTVEISFISYDKFERSNVEVKANAITTVNAQLSPSNNALSEVVVTAMGIKREEKALGYAVTKIDSTQLTDAVANNWTDALSGKVAGLNLIRSNGGPAGSNKIILRGENNLTGDNEALIVVDGVVINNSGGRRTTNASDAVYGTGSDNMPADYGSSLNDINPEDIESVTVLKGPGAAALYGQRGANGAVIITTKSGSKKQQLNIKFTSNGSFETPNRWPDMQYEYGQGLDGASYYSYGTSADGASTSGTSSAYGPRFDGQLFFQYDPVTQGQSNVRTPWVPYKNQIREFFETGTDLRNSLSLSGTYKNTSARLSITNQNNTWIVPNTGMERTSVSLNLNSRITRKLDVSVTANYVNRFSDNLPGNGYGNQSLMYWFIFWQPNADLNSLKNYWVNGRENELIKYPFSSYPENPYAISEEFINHTGRNGITGNIQANYKFSKELSLLLRASLDLAKEHRGQERPYDAGSRLPTGSYRRQKIYGDETNLQFMLKYNKNINKDFNVTATAGGEQLKNRYNKEDLRADGLKIPNLYRLDNNLYPIISIPDTSRYNINSFFGMLTGSYKGYLNLELTARQDWSSVLATVTRTTNVGFFYPAASASFIMSDLWRFPSAISMAKLRLSASQVGSGGTTPYRTAYTYSLAANGTYPDTALTNPSILPNPNLKPLKTTAYEIGADLRFFKDRLGLDVAYYIGHTNNQILTRTIDRASGHNFQIINAGQINNSGIEIALNGSPIKNKNGFTWSAFATFASNKNRIISLPDSNIILRTGPIAGGQIVAKVGGRMGDMYGRGYERAPDGQIIYDATTGNAKITTDVVYLGNSTPKYKFSLGNDFHYRGLSLKVLFDAQVGAIGHSLLNYKMVEQGKLKSTLPGRYSGIVGDGVIQNADGTFRPNDVIAYDVDEYYRSHMGADNAEGSTFSTDFIKFREASLSYSFPKRWLSNTGLSSIDLGLYGRNLFIWSPWPMFDPEFGTMSGSDIVTGFEVGQFPSTRSFGFNLVVGI